MGTYRGWSCRQRLYSDVCFGSCQWWSDRSWPATVVMRTVTSVVHAKQAAAHLFMPVMPITAT